MAVMGPEKKDEHSIMVQLWSGSRMLKPFKFRENTKIVLLKKLDLIVNYLEEKILNKYG